MTPSGSGSMLDGGGGRLLVPAGGALGVAMFAFLTRFAAVRSLPPLLASVP